MSPTGRLKAVYTCPECKGLFRPTHKEQVVCARPCDLARRKRLGLYPGFTQAANKKAAATRKRKMWERIRARAVRELAQCRSKNEVFRVGYRMGYALGAAAGQRRGYADGFSAALGELKESA